MAKTTILMLALLVSTGFGTVLLVDAAPAQPVLPSPAATDLATVSILQMDEFFPTPIADILRPLAARFGDCDECMSLCQFYPQPTRRQCEAYCYRTIPSCRF